LVHRPHRSTGRFLGRTSGTHAPPSRRGRAGLDVILFFTPPLQSPFAHLPRAARTCRASPARVPGPLRDLTRARPRSGRRIRRCAIQAPSLFQGPDGRWIRSPNHAEARPAVRPRAFRLSADAKAPTASLRSVLRFSQPLDGLLRARARGSVSPRCHVQDPSRSGCSPRARPPSLFERSLPPCRCSPSTHRRSGCHGTSARLRGLHPCESALPPRALSTRAKLAPLLGFFSSRPAFSRRGSVLLGASARAVTACGLRFRARRLRPTSAYHPRETRRNCLQNRQPARVFEPSAR